MVSDAQELFEAGELDDALGVLKEEVRQNPGDAERRVFLFQLFSIQGQWESARNQLDVIRDMDDSMLMMVELYGEALGCEPRRQSIFAGQRTPMFAGEPDEWEGVWVKANELAAEGDVDGARGLREEAWEAIPELNGVIHGEDFQWIMDGDTRLGPFMEVILNGEYYWVPLTRIESIEIQSPTDLRHLIWVPVAIVWDSGGEVGGLMPVRYPGSEEHEDPAVRLARRTDWREAGGGEYHGIGQKMLLTDAGQYPIVESGEIRIER